MISKNARGSLQQSKLFSFLSVAFVGVAFVGGGACGPLPNMGADVGSEGSAESQDALHTEATTAPDRPDCDESHAQCDQIPPTCKPGTIPRIVNGCYGACVDPRNCAFHSVNCDAAQTTCDQMPPKCESGFTPSVIGDCFGPCVRNEQCIQQPDLNCTYGGVEYKNGDTWSAGDGCNDCSCTDGYVACTDRACQNDKEEE